MSIITSTYLLSSPNTSEAHAKCRVVHDKTVSCVLCPLETIAIDFEFFPVGNNCADAARMKGLIVEVCRSNHAMKD